MAQCPSVLRLGGAADVFTEWAWAWVWAEGPMGTPLRTSSPEVPWGRGPQRGPQRSPGPHQIREERGQKPWVLRQPLRACPDHQRRRVLQRAVDLRFAHTCAVCRQHGSQTNTPAS